MKLRIPNNNSRGNSDNFHKMIFLSIFVHFVIITMVLISMPSSSRRLTFGPVYSVQLVGSDVALSRDYSPLSGYIKPNEDSGSSIIKREFVGINSTPIKKEETNKLDVEKAIKAIKQKDNSQETAPAAGKSKSGVSVSALTGTNSSNGQTSAQRNEYLSIIWSRVKRNWTLPSALMPKENVESIIDVKISRSGAVEYIGFEKRSGNRYFDDSAINAVKKSIPFPPPPYYFSGNHMEIGIRFHSKELQQNTER